MKVQLPQMFPGQTFDAVLATVPSQVSRSETQVVLEVAAPAPLVFYPGSATSVELVEATLEEREALRLAGFDLPAPTGQEPSPSAGKRPWWKLWGWSVLAKTTVPPRGHSLGGG